MDSIKMARLKLHLGKADLIPTWNSVGKVSAQGGTELYIKGAQSVRPKQVNTTGGGAGGRRESGCCEWQKQPLTEVTTCICTISNPCAVARLLYKALWCEQGRTTLSTFFTSTLRRKTLWLVAAPLQVFEDGDYLGHGIFKKSGACVASPLKAT